MSISSIVNGYFIHKKAYSLGVRFTVNDLDIQQINYYAIIDEEIEKFKSRKK